MQTIEQHLSAFLRSDLARALEPGPCGRMIDRWIMERRGFSILHRGGKPYLTEEDVAFHLAQPGGFPVAVNRVMRACGLHRTREPLLGDVALVFLPGPEPVVGLAIKTAGGWVGRNDNGLFCVPNFWKAWSV